MKLTFAQKASDKVAAIVGSWKFILIQAALLIFWIAINSLTPYIWDEKPYILLNLCLSFQAAFTAPIIMMAQNRQSAIDRLKASHDYKTNTKAELEIRQLHEKIDLLKAQEIRELIDIIKIIAKN